MMEIKMHQHNTRYVNWKHTRWIRTLTLEKGQLVYAHLTRLKQTRWIRTLTLEKGQLVYAHLTRLKQTRWIRTLTLEKGQLVYAHLTRLKQTRWIRTLTLEKGQLVYAHLTRLKQTRWIRTLTLEKGQLVYAHLTRLLAFLKFLQFLGPLKVQNQNFTSLAQYCTQKNYKSFTNDSGCSVVWSSDCNTARSVWILLWNVL